MSCIFVFLDKLFLYLLYGEMFLEIYCHIYLTIKTDVEVIFD